MDNPKDKYIRRSPERRSSALRQAVETPVHGYRVCETRATEGRVVLHDAWGRYHLAHFAGDIPLLWEELLGEPPACGSNLLTALTGGMYRASFESINLRSKGLINRVGGHASSPSA